MVRFSDLIKRRDKKDQKSQNAVREGKKDGFRLSDSEKLEKNRNKEELPIDISAMKDDTTPEIVTFYEKFLNKKITHGKPPADLLAQLNHSYF